MPLVRSTCDSHSGDRGLGHGLWAPHRQAKAGSWGPCPAVHRWVHPSSYEDGRNRLPSTSSLQSTVFFIFQLLHRNTYFHLFNFVKHIQALGCGSRGLRASFRELGELREAVVAWLSVPAGALSPRLRSGDTVGRACVISTHDPVIVSQTQGCPWLSPRPRVSADATTQWR